MANITTNKKAIITFNEIFITSHAMTVARELDIMCMGFENDLKNPNSFSNNVRTGDIVRIKSNGKKAVAYVEKEMHRDIYKK